MITWRLAMITAEHCNINNHTTDRRLTMSSNLPSKSSSTGRRRPAMIIAMIPLGAVGGLIGGLLIEIIVGLIARSVFSAEHPGAQAWQLLGSLPGLGALIGAIVTPILYGRSKGATNEP
jgi:hypothetical protein